jgi:hypothetical protein
VQALAEAAALLGSSPAACAQATPAAAEAAPPAGATPPTELALLPRLRARRDVEMVPTASVTTQRRIAWQLADQTVINLRAECAARSADASDTAVLLLSRLSGLLDVEWRVDEPTGEFAPTDTSIVCNIIDVHTRRHGAWSDRPTVMVEEDEVKVVDVVVEAVGDAATIARLGKAGHPGKLFALTVSEIDALDAACWEEEEGD